MFKIKGNDIYISRGDAFALDINVTDEEGNAYQLDTLEKLRLTVYGIGTGNIVSEICSEGGSNHIEVGGDITRRWRYRLGYKVQILYADGSAETLVGETATYIPRVYVMEVVV